MSVRAHRVDKIVWDYCDTFSLSDEKLIDALNINRYLDDDGCGIVWVAISDLEDAIRRTEELEIDESTARSIQADITLAKHENEEFVKYYLL